MIEEALEVQHRLLPRNEDAEQAVLGSLLIDPTAIDRVASFLRPDDFFFPAHVKLYDAMVELSNEGKPPDVVTVSDYITRRDRLAETGGLEYLATLANAVPTALNVVHYARIVEHQALLRRLIDAGVKIEETGYDQANSPEAALEKAEDVLFAVSRRKLGADFRALGAILSEYNTKLDWIHGHRGLVTGVPTGYVLIDQLLGGFQKSDLIVLAARPAMGKTSLALNIARDVAVNHQLHVGIFSLEMSAEQLAQRLVSMEANVDSQHLRTGFIPDHEWATLDQAIQTLWEAPIYIEDSANLSIAELRSKSRRLALEKGLDLIIVDYLQLMQGRRQENRVQETSEISRALKGVARELNVPLLAVSQLSRAPEQRPNHVPMLSDLRESGSIEQDADIVMFIYRESVYNDDAEHPNLADVIIAKHRNGPTGKVKLFFKESQTKFLDLPPYKEEDL
jgi:replicative DNA helicase